ncbi:MipA/OmpV family protein [Antarcticirhabdus aurantiaca]|uniref:MipA/OmpV family protein n=1 Tax=Antarcticirhabdus aurantiaca TaxID=2606717 RepID=A0ACD4NNC4_9HYPH|nr:MipA/OmpV family protein [Antarcticirhabdus aurantiaca]WAJ28401.1 MipA/OmpV family protein [Jeongeuplla avenae]
MSRAILRFAILAVSAVASVPASATDTQADPAGVPLTPDERIDAVFELGAGAMVSPEYEGSDDYEASPWPILGLDYLSIPGLVTFGSINPQGGGLSIGPSFGYGGERDDDDLDGLDDIDATYEAGIKLGYEWNNAEVYGEARYAFGGADGFVGAVGANAIARPNQALLLKAGPRATFASDDYMNTYFGVDADEFVRSGGKFDAFEADGGVKSVGLEASARYEFAPTWFLNAEGSYMRLVGDAKDSPIVQEEGSEDQLTFGLGLSKRFSVDLF